MAKKLYGNRITPKCEYCIYGTRAKEGNKVLCIKRGLVNEDDKCIKYIYSPIKRIPKKRLIPNSNLQNIL